MSRKKEDRSLFWPLISLALALALAAGTFFWLSQSTLLAVETIDVSGNHALSSEQVMDIIGPRLQGESLLKLSYDDAGDALRELPFVKEVQIRRDFPHTLHVEIFEYRPVVCYGSDAGSFFLSDDARVLSTADQTGTSLPVLKTKEPCGADVGDFMECGDVRTGVDFIISVPVDLHQEFTRVSVTGGVIDAATLGGIEVHFGTMDDYAYKFEVLRQLIARTTSAGEQVIIDVSVPDRPVTRDKNMAPAAGEADSDTGAAAGEEAAVDEAAIGEAAVLPEETAAAP